MRILGTRFKEVGSKMSLTASAGQLSDLYETAVGYAYSQYALLGKDKSSPSSGGQASSWAVAWQNPYPNAHSATSWSGQYQTNPDTGEEAIYTL